MPGSISCLLHNLPKQDAHLSHRHLHQICKEGPDDVGKRKQVCVSVNWCFTSHATIFQSYM